MGPPCDPRSSIEHLDEASELDQTGLKVDAHGIFG